jgi:hypothetical protein
VDQITFNPGEVRENVRLIAKFGKLIK